MRNKRLTVLNATELAELSDFALYGRPCSINVDEKTNIDDGEMKRMLDVRRKFADRNPDTFITTKIYFTV